MKSQDNKNIMIVSIATLIGWLINYLVHPIAVRYLSTTDFGEFEALLGMINIMWFIMSAGTIITLKLIAEHHSRSDFMYYLKTKLQRPLLLIWCLARWFIIWCSIWIADGLQINNHWWIIIMGATIITSFYGIILSAILQSGWWFKSLSLIGVSGSIIRLWAIIIVVFWLSGWSTEFIGATIIAGFVSFLITEYLVRKHLWAHELSTIIQYDGTLVQELKYKSKTYLNLIMITIAIGILTNGDILIAQHVFGGELSGTYASVAVIAKFVVFIGLAAETVLLPKLLSIDQTPSRSQIGSIIALMLWFGILSLIGWRVLWWWVLHLLKPWLESHLWLLLWALMISWCVLTLSISSKTLVNTGSRAPLWIICIAWVLRYLLSMIQVRLSDYVQVSVIILWTTTIVMQGLRRVSGRSSTP